jgi:hypothetical protein
MEKIIKAFLTSKKLRKGAALMALVVTTMNAGAPWTGK